MATTRKLYATTRESPHTNILNMAGTASLGNIMTCGNISSSHPRSGYINDKY